MAIAHPTQQGEFNRLNETGQKFGARSRTIGSKLAEVIQLPLERRITLPQYIGRYDEDQRCEYAR